MIRFKFLYKPEYIKPGNIVLFREGRTRGIGVIQTVYYTERSLRESAPHQTTHHGHATAAPAAHSTVAAHE